MEEHKEPVPPETNDEIREQELQQQEQDEQALFPPNEVTDNSTGITYRIEKLIGTSCDGAIQVYRATYFIRNAYKRSVALKLVGADQESPDYNDLVKRVARNRENGHPNIMGIGAAFTDKGMCCVHFDYMDYGSVRFVIRSQFPNGIPLAYVVATLKEALGGLRFLHSRGRAHREISAGQIFFSTLPQIKLSFSGSVYDDHGLDQDDDDPHYLPVKSISKWASAPEVYGSQNDELYDSRADIWMIGITALELAYGEAKIRSRDHLMSIVGKINDEQKILPLREVEQNPPRSIRHLHFEDDIKIMFDKFVCKCLATDPANRPTASQLLDTELFTTVNRPLPLAILSSRRFLISNDD